MIEQTGKKLSVALAALLLPLALASAASATPNDAWITTKVKLALVKTDGVATGLSAINVDTVNRQVTLHGTVSAAPEKEKAERAAKSVDGVQSVRNLLAVVAPAKQEAVAERDQGISADVGLALGKEDSLGDSNISVQSVNKGIVLLQGTARTLTDHLTAVEIAGNVQGVRRVESEIQSPDTLADADLWNEKAAVKETPMPAGNLGNAPAPGHAENTVAVNAVRDPATGESINPNVNVDNTKAAGSYGKADDPVENQKKVAAIDTDDREEKRAAAHAPDTETAEEIPGDRGKEPAGVAGTDSAAAKPDKMKADKAAAETANAEKKTAEPASPTAKAAKRASGAAGDLYTTSMVKMRLLANDETPAMDINVDTHRGVVTLFGIVSEENAKKTAETEARQVDGVTSVKNELQVVASAKKEAVEARDDEIVNNLQKSMGERVALKNVEVDVKNCVARLSGTVPSGIERLEAMQVARSTRGVCSVKNDLHVNN